MKEKSFISYDIKHDKKEGKIKIQVTIEAETVSRNPSDVIPWQKFKTSNAREVLVDKGYDLGKCLQESPMLVNSDGAVSGVWIFSDNITPGPLPVKPAPRRRRKTSSKTKRG